MSDEKKKYYRMDNGDQPIIDENINVLIDLVKAEAGDVTEGEDARIKHEWVIDLVWLTEEEYKNLPEAY